MLKHTAISLGLITLFAASSVVAAVPTVDVAVSVSDGSSNASAGSSLFYDIAVTNYGPDTANNVTVADTFPASLTCVWTCTGFGGGMCAASGLGNINDTGVILPAFSEVTYVVQCYLSEYATGTLSNTATATAAGADDINMANNSSTDQSTIIPPADLGITITDGVTTAVPGGSVTYTITASNAGPGDAPGAYAQDFFPESLTCTWTCVGAGGGTCTAAGSGSINDTVNLPVNGSVTYTASCTISASATGSLANTATVTAQGYVVDLNPGNDNATDTDTLAPQADLAVTNTDGVTTAVPGGSTTYTITASNAGPSNATGAVVQDTFPASLTCTWTCVGAGGGTCTASGSGNLSDTVNLPANGSVTYTASCTISASATGSLSDTVTVAAPDGVTDPIPGNNSATDVDTLTPQADLAITNTDGATSAVPGGSVTYTITASNAGPSNTAGAVVQNTFPASLTCTWTCIGAGGGTCTAAGSGNINDTVNLPSGGSNTYTASCTVSASATGSLSDTATIAAPGGVTDPTPGNNSATDTDTTTPQADLAITIDDNVSSIDSGDTITYEIVVTNLGASDVANVTVQDMLPSTLDDGAWTCTADGGSCSASGTGDIDDEVDLPVGATLTYTLTAIVVSTGTTVVNTATVVIGSAGTDTDLTNNTASASADVVPPPATELDLSMSLTASATAPQPGDAYDYEVTVGNDGPGDAASVIFTLTVPSVVAITGQPDDCISAGVVVTCTISDLEAEDAVSRSITVQVNDDVTDGADLSAFAALVTEDTDATNDDATVTLSAVVPDDDDDDDDGDITRKKKDGGCSATGAELATVFAALAMLRRRKRA